MPTLHDTAKVLQDCENARLRRENSQQLRLIEELNNNAYLRACLQTIAASKAIHSQWKEASVPLHDESIMLIDMDVHPYLDDNRQSHHDTLFDPPQPIDMNPLLSSFDRRCSLESYVEHRKVIPFLNQLGYHVKEFNDGPVDRREMWVYLQKPGADPDDSENGLVKLWDAGYTHDEFDAKSFVELCEGK